MKFKLIMIVALIGLTGFPLFPITAHAQEEQEQFAPTQVQAPRPQAQPAPPSYAGTVCFPPAWGGIVPGITEERDLVALYGDGLSEKDSSGVVTRYYSDPDKSVSVVVEVGTDGVVDSVKLVSGVTVPDGYDPDSAYTSERVDPGEGFGNYYKLHLGATRAEVRGNLGEPPSAKDADADPNVWSYGTDYISDCYGQATMTVTFVGDRVSSIEFYNGG